MALDAINEIKKAELQAEDMISEANKASKELILNAHSEAEKQYDSIVKDARAKADKLIQEAVEAGNVEAKPILENGEKEKESIRNLSPTLKENAINIVVERIVKSHGNS